VGYVSDVARSPFRLFGSTPSRPRRAPPTLAEDGDEHVALASGVRREECFYLAVERG
jgi:hypothetical protein